MTTIRRLRFSVSAVFAVAISVGPCQAASRPNVVLLMADDLGYGDTGYNGNRVIKTPHLDAMAAEGINFTRFYAAAPVCSPTRASCLTGRHPYRTGIFFANTGILRPEELTVAEVLRDAGYATGHFGKWHLGTFSKTQKDANRGGTDPALFNPPERHGFETYFSTESKVPTWDPMLRPAATDRTKRNLKFGWDFIKDREKAEAYGTAYWTPSGIASENLDGDDSRVIMDSAIPFIEEAVNEARPFFTVVWFHAPHLPVVAGPKYAAMYADQPFKMRQFAGCVTAMDEQIGRLRDTLSALGVADDTMIWFCSDNGPEGNDSSPGSAGGLRGRKRSLYEGGVRVPGLLVWPAGAKGSVVDAPVVTSDYFPTILAAAGVELPADAPPLDGVSVLPLIAGDSWERPVPIAFASGGRFGLAGPRYKLYGTDELYDLTGDPAEAENIAGDRPEIVSEYLRTHEAAYESWRKSFELGDYETDRDDFLRQTFPERDKSSRRRAAKGL
ncbi:MAG: sulfatase-like hydrolase/transferase [Planctomycetota bacterium]